MRRGNGMIVELDMFLQIMWTDSKVRVSDFFIFLCFYLPYDVCIVVLFLPSGISLLVRAESDGSLLLESKIQPDTAYQKQQDTLIVWSEGDNFDLALSFQEKAGCDEIWEKICQVIKTASCDITSTKYLTLS